MGLLAIEAKHAYNSSVQVSDEFNSKRKERKKCIFCVMHYMALFYIDILIQTFSRCLICVYSKEKWL